LREGRTPEVPAQYRLLQAIDAFIDAARTHLNGDSSASRGGASRSAAAFSSVAAFSGRGVRVMPGGRSCPSSRRRSSRRSRRG
jgi:hypothetical protein